MPGSGGIIGTLARDNRLARHAMSVNVVSIFTIAGNVVFFVRDRITTALADWGWALMQSAPKLHFVECLRIAFRQPPARRWDAAEVIGIAVVSSIGLRAIFSASYAICFHVSSTHAYPVATHGPRCCGHCLPFAVVMRRHDLHVTLQLALFDVTNADIQREPAPHGAPLAWTRGPRAWRLIVL